MLPSRPGPILGTAMKVHLSDSSFLGHLMDDLLRGGCIASRVEADTVVVKHPDAADAREAQLELHFFLRAWEFRHPGVALTVN
jgi:hypothetical protein